MKNYHLFIVYLLLLLFNSTSTFALNKIKASDGILKYKMPTLTAMMSVTTTSTTAKKQSNFANKKRSTAIGLSFLFPGAGQYYLGAKKAGAAMTGVGVGGLCMVGAGTMTLLFGTGFTVKQNETSAEKRSRTIANDAGISLISIGLGAMLGSTIWSMIDAGKRFNGNIHWRALNISSKNKLYNVQLIPAAPSGYGATAQFNF